MNRRARPPLDGSLRRGAMSARRSPFKTWVVDTDTGACEYTTPKAFAPRSRTPRLRTPRASNDERRLARAVARACARASRVFEKHGAVHDAHAANALSTVKRATKVLFTNLGFDLARSTILRGAFESEACARDGALVGFLEVTKEMMSYLYRSRAFKCAVEFMENDDHHAAYAVLESVCGDRTVGVLVGALLESYRAKFAGADANDSATSPASIFGAIFSRGRHTPALATAVLHQVLVGALPRVMQPRGARVTVEDVVADAKTPTAMDVDERFAAATPASMRHAIVDDEDEHDASDSDMHAAGSSTDDDDDSDSELVIIGEFKAPSPTPKMKFYADLHWSMQTQRLALRVQSVVEDGNCGFRSIAHGLEALAKVGLWKRDGNGEGWQGVRKMLCDGLVRCQKRASEKELAKLYDLVLSGNEGREYLRQGSLRRASEQKRFAKYISTMRKDAAPYAATSKWTRFWCTDSELVAIATMKNIAIVVVEATEDVNAAAKSPFFVALPPLPAGINRPAKQLGKYYADGELHWGRKTVQWRSYKTSTEYTLSLMDVSRARQCTSQEPCRSVGHIPAICLKHHPGHFEALVPVIPSQHLVVWWRIF